MPINSTWTRKKGSTLFCFLLLMLLTPPIFHPELRNSTTQATSDLTEARVAIYNCDRLDNFSFTACIHLFEWMNATVELVTGTEIQQGVLNAFDLLVLPAFGPSSYERELTPVGKERIRQFLAMGGSLFTICRGTEFAVTCLGIIDATLHYIGSIGVQCHDTHNGELECTEMIVNHASTGPDLSEEPDSYMVFTTGAQYFEIHGPTEVIPILSYTETGLPGVIVFRYGQGTVMLSSPHPEFEEGDNRDGLSAANIVHWPTYQDLQDPDSEWDLLNKVAYWLIDASPGIPANVFSGPLILIGGAFALLFTTILILEFRKRPK
ncbi:MAG: hypothetical protein ACFFCF_08995 [Promethearchaeota archaeon]